MAAFDSRGSVVGGLGLQGDVLLLFSALFSVCVWNDVGRGGGVTLLCVGLVVVFVYEGLADAIAYERVGLCAEEVHHRAVTTHNGLGFFVRGGGCMRRVCMFVAYRGFQRLCHDWATQAVVHKVSTYY